MRLFTIQDWKFHKGLVNQKLHAPMESEPMDELTVENFRCFGAEQSARLAPLTLLVGENSTGKTSFMALASILWEAVYGGNHLPEFKRLNFDLGTFQDIVHEGSDGPGKEFSGGFGIKDWTCRVTFQRRISRPEVIRLHIMNSTGSVTWNRDLRGWTTVHARTGDKDWHTSYADDASPGAEIRQEFYTQRRWGLLSIYDELDKMRPVSGDSEITEEEKNVISTLALFPYNTAIDTAIDIKKIFSDPMAMPPIRSRPERNYDRGYSSPNPVMERIPQYLAGLRSDPDRKKQWKAMKQALDTNGRETGLFEEIDIRLLGEDSDSDPFQLQFRVHDGNGGSSLRNIVDVGYGVSQFLPVIVELIEGNHPLLLLQQPEVHLHPRAQAGLGSILCTIADQNRQILVETHSDYLIDRVCREVRNQEKTQLKPEDVSILYFERAGPGVEIHNLRIDGEGNICGAPPSYRQFFMEEIDRNLGFT